jgi:hypothetical protein
MSWLGRFGVLLLPVAAVSILQMIYMAIGATPSGRATLLFEFSLAWAFILWVEADARHRHIVPCHDFGFLVAVFFPLSLVWYVFWSRGRRGILALTGLLGVMILPWLTAVAVWVMANGLR